MGAMPIFLAIVVPFMLTLLTLTQSMLLFMVWLLTLSDLLLGQGWSSLAGCLQVCAPTNHLGFRVWSLGSEQLQCGDLFQPSRIAQQ